LLSTTYLHTFQSTKVPNTVKEKLKSCKSKNRRRLEVGPHDENVLNILTAPHASMMCGYNKLAYLLALHEREGVLYRAYVFLLYMP